MSRIALLIFAMVATAMMGTIIVISLAMGYDTAKPIITSAVIGFVLAIPTSYIIANKLSEFRG